MKKIFYLVPNNKIHPLSKLFLDKKSFEYIYLPLKGIKKFLFLFFNIFYPIFRLNHNQIFILFSMFLKRKNKLISYSYVSRKIQDLSNKFSFIRIIQIQNGSLHPLMVNSLNLENIDIFFSYSKYQSKFALKHFAKEAYVVGSLSTEYWLKNIDIAIELKGFKYDICFICNAKFRDDDKYALFLCINYILSDKKLSLVIASKLLTDIEAIAIFCRKKFNIDIFEHNQIFLTKKYTKFTTIQRALESKVIVGVRSTVLFQAGSLGLIIYPIDISKSYGKASGNLSKLKLDLYPSKNSFAQSMKKLSTKKGMELYFKSNFNVLTQLDDTLRLSRYPSDNIINYLKDLK